MHSLYQFRSIKPTNYLFMHNRHCEIFKARDAGYYTRLETAALSEQFIYNGPFTTAHLALVYLQQKHGVGSDFYLDETGRRPIPANTQPAGAAV